MTVIEIGMGATGQAWMIRYSFHDSNGRRRAYGQGEQVRLGGALDGWMVAEQYEPGWGEQ